MNQLVSVVIPTYNRALDLARALDSLLNQTHILWEALVVDNCSTDGTDELIRRINDKRIRYLTVSNHGVIAQSRNIGITHAVGEFVAFLDSDDGWRRDKLEKSVLWLNQGYDFVYHDMNIAFSKVTFLRRRIFASRQVSQDAYDDLLINGNACPTSSVVIRKAVLAAVGGFSELRELIAGEDYDLWLRVSAKTPRFRRIEGTLGYLGRGNNNQFTARRVVSYIAEIENRYISKLPNSQKKEAYSNWIDYGLGRSQYQLGNYRAAQSHLINVVRASINILDRIKAIYMLGAIGLRRLVGDG